MRNCMCEQLTEIFSTEMKRFDFSEKAFETNFKLSSQAVKAMRELARISVQQKSNQIDSVIVFGRFVRF